VHFYLCRVGRESFLQPSRRAIVTFAKAGGQDKNSFQLVRQ